MNTGPGATVVRNGKRVCASNNRIVYNPLIHTQHRMDWTDKEKETLCAMYEITKPKRELALLLGRTESACGVMAATLRSKGMFEAYKARGRLRLGID